MINQLKHSFKDFSHLAKMHPCLGGEAHRNYGRVHLPVSPACNIQCKFCKRNCNLTEERPGVTYGILTPEKAVETVLKALELCPQISVVGIAGPGDTLATPHALKTFKLVHEAFPDLIKCLSTNGLMLEHYAYKLADVGVSTVTVTVNAVYPHILSQIVSHIVFEGKKYVGEEAAGILINKQLKGIAIMSHLGIIVKVNSVLIPGVNENHFQEIAKMVKKAGAGLFNIIPLIPQHELGQIPVPTCKQLNNAREAAELYLEVFRHCRHCRADACGIPGKTDLSRVLYGVQSSLETFSHG